MKRRTSAEDSDSQLSSRLVTIVAPVTPATAWLGDRRSHDNQNETLLTTHFRFPHALQRVGTGSGKFTLSPHGVGALLIFFSQFSCSARQSHSLAPAARFERRRAQRPSMMARQRHRRLVIEGREHDGMLARHKARIEHLPRPSFA